MTDEQESALKQFVKTTNATTNVLLCLLQDLAPIIGLNEAQRLVNIIDEAQKGDTE